MFRNRFRWVVVALLFSITIVNYIDRSAISYAAPDISKALGFSSSEMGLVLGAFGLGYFATTLVGGIATDKFGAKIVLGVAALAWTLSIGLSGLAVGFVMLYAARVGLGLAEGPSFPALTGAVGRWLPSGERATALAGTLVAVPISLAIGAPLVSWMITVAGWRPMFFLLTGLGLLWLPLWFWLFRDDPAASPHVSVTERKLIAESTAKRPLARPANERSLIRIVFATPTLLSNYWAFFVFGYFLFFFLTWMPSYLHDTFGLKIITVGFLAAIPWLTSALAMLAVGRVSDRILQRTGRLRLSRSVPIAATQAVAAIAVIPIALIDNLVVSMVGLTIAVAATLAANAAYFAVNIDLLPRHAAPALGVMDAAFAAAGFFAPVITGFVYHGTDSFLAAFILMAILAISSVAAVLLFHHPDRDRESLQYAAPPPPTP
ncbi:MAG: MFS transporter [Pseudomonadota bacterium]